MGKSATLNLRVNPTLKQNAESVLGHLRYPVAAFAAEGMTRIKRRALIHDLLGLKPFVNLSAILKF